MWIYLLHGNALMSYEDELEQFLQNIKHFEKTALKHALLLTSILFHGWKVKCPGNL